MAIIVQGDVRHKLSRTWQHTVSVNEWVPLWNRLHVDPIHVTPVKALMNTDQSIMAVSTILWAVCKKFSATSFPSANNIFSNKQTPWMKTNLHNNVRTVILSVFIHQSQTYYHLKIV